MQNKGFINKNGNITNKLQESLKKNDLKLPEKFKPESQKIKIMLNKLLRKINIKNANEKIHIKTQKDVITSKEFKSLWNKIKDKTTYRIEFDNQQLINDCIQEITKNLPQINTTKARFRKGSISIGKEGIKSTELKTYKYTEINNLDIKLPDILTSLEEKTHLTRKSLIDILNKSNFLKKFKENPQQFIDITADAINRRKKLILVNGICYKRLGKNQYYSQELFNKEELIGYKKNTLKTNKSVYDHVVYESEGIERKFAKNLEKNESIKVYTKLPRWFKIQTPLGTYNPDWAILVETEYEEKVYFVVETKGLLWQENLRTKEEAKIKCGEKHFKELAKNKKKAAKYIVVTDVDEMLKRIESIEDDDSQE